MNLFDLILKAHVLDLKILIFFISIATEISNFPVVRNTSKYEAKRGLKCMERVVIRNVLPEFSIFHKYITYFFVKSFLSCHLDVHNVKLMSPLTLSPHIFLGMFVELIKK